MGGSTTPPSKRYSHSFVCRGIPNVSVLVVLILALLYLFIFYPVLIFYRDEKRNDAIQGNVRVNATAVLFLFSFMLKNLRLFSFKCQNQPMRLRRKKRVVTQDLMGISTS